MINSMIEKLSSHTGNDFRTKVNVINVGNVFSISLTHHLYVQDMAWCSVRFYIGFTIQMLNLLKHAPLSVMYVTGASNHQQIAFICCGDALNDVMITW